MTVVPASRTGSSTALGVSTPVRPTWMTMSTTLEGFTSGGYLYAAAHRGNLAVLPRVSRWLRSLTLMTAPSMSKGNSSRFSPMAATRSTASSMVAAL